jgi:predicted MFS family arabinose efflux permease
MAADLRRNGPWTLLAVLTIVRIAYGVQFQAVGAVGPAMVRDLGLAYASLGTLVGAYSLLGLVLALPAGWLTARLGDRRTVLAALGLMIAGGSMLAGAPGFDVALGGRIVSGAGAVLLMVSLPAIIMKHFTGAALPAAVGTLLAGFPIGIGLASAGLPVLGSWRLAMAATAALCLVALIGAAIVLAGGSGRAVEARGRTGLGVGELMPVIAVGLVWGSLNAGFAALFGFAAVFFVGEGLSLRDAGALVSLTAFATVPLAPLGGWLLGRLRRPLLGIAGGLVAVSACVLVLAQGSPPAVPLIVFGLLLGAIAGPIVALPAAVLAPAHRAMGMGVFWTAFFVLMTVLPPLAGLARDLTGAGAAPLYAAAAFIVLGLPALTGYAGLRRPIVMAARVE